MEKIKEEIITESANFRENVDAWIKDINYKFDGYEGIVEVVNENVDNIQHNYELVYELKDELEEVKKDIKQLKLINWLILKKVNRFLKKDGNLKREDFIKG